MKMYRKTALQPMEPWAEGMDLEHVSVSDFDLENGSPKRGDMIAHGDKGDMWLVAKRFFKDNYELHIPEVSTGRSADNGNCQG